MTTTVETENGLSHVLVENGTYSATTETGVHTIFVHDGSTGGEVWLQVRLFGITLPIPLAPFRNIVRVNQQEPDGRIWTGDNSRKIHFKPTKPI